MSLFRFHFNVVHYKRRNGAPLHQGGQGWPPGSWIIFAALPDPHRQAGRRHCLSDILPIAICAAFCGADEFSAMAGFGRAKRKWVRNFLRLPHGIPSEDTCEQVLARLDPEAFERCFMSGVGALAGSSDGELVAIDGKTLRRSFDRADKKVAIHMVSAWAQANELCGGQLATEAKRNERSRPFPSSWQCSTSRAPR